jgi:hypothetical protein
MFNKREILMVLETENYRFEKGASEEAGQVSIVNLHNGYEIDVFTDYTIGTNLDRMEKSCAEWVEEHGVLDHEE